MKKILYLTICFGLIGCNNLKKLTHKDEIPNHPYVWVLPSEPSPVTGYQLHKYYGTLPSTVPYVGVNEDPSNSLVEVYERGEDDSNWVKAVPYGDAGDSSYQFYTTTTLGSVVQYRKLQATNSQHIQFCIYILSK